MTTANEIPEKMKAAKEDLFRLWSKEYGNDIWGAGIGMGPNWDSDKTLHIRLYTTREDVKARIIKDTPMIDGYPVHVEVGNIPVAN